MADAEVSEVNSSLTAIPEEPRSSRVDPPAVDPSATSSASQPVPVKPLQVGAIATAEPPKSKGINFKIIMQRHPVPNYCLHSKRS